MLFYINQIIFLKKRMLEDKILDILRQINQLTSQREHIKYIIPLFYNAIKIIYDNCAHRHLEPALLEQVSTSYRQIIYQKQQQLSLLNQIHYFMLEECTEMIESKHINKIISKRKLSEPINTDSQLKQQQTISLAQEIYHLDDQYKVISTESSQNQQQAKVKIIKPKSFDSVADPKKQLESIDLMWSNVQKLYQEHKIDEAYLQSQKFHNSLFLYDSNFKLSEPKQKLVNKIRDEYKTMKHFYSYFDETGYIFDKTQKQVSMYYKISQQSKEVSVKVQAELDVSIQNFLCIIAEIDLYSEYVPFAYDTKQLKKIMRNQKVGLTRVYIPLINNREAYFVASAYDRLKTHNSIFVFSRTITSDLEYQKKIGFQVPKHSELVELQYKFYNLEYTPLKNNRCRIRLAANIDLKLGFLPLFIINKSLRTFSFDFFQNMIRLNKNFEGSLWQEKMKQNPQFYRYFKERIRNYLLQNNM